MEWKHDGSSAPYKGWTISYPLGFKEFLTTHGIKQVFDESGELGKTPDGRIVKMKEIIFVCPSKDIAALLKLSYL
jgi:hypothetical protein